MPLNRLARAALLAGTVLCAVPAQAQDSAPQTVIHAGRLIDRPGQRSRGPSTIVVENGRIVAVRDGIVAPDRADARVIDLTGQTVLPGLIDSHVHLTS
ncbi:MAG TPA: amidohydrolase family protein, partial [Novosphingobium sp.]|nr:amidohydrolase family protein [Novosphingobium sp.]